MERHWHDVNRGSAVSPAVPAVRSALLVDLDGGFSAGAIRRRRRAHYRRSVSWLVAIRTIGVLRRIADFSLAALLLMLLSPFLAFFGIFLSIQHGGVSRRVRLGRWATRFTLYEFYIPQCSKLSRLRFFRSAPALWNVLKGDMSFVGPRPVAPRESLTEDPVAWKRYDLRPGLLSLWWLRKQANIAYASETGLDLEYVETCTLVGDVGIALRAIPAIFLGSGVSDAPRELRFLGVRIDNLTMAEASSQIVALAKAQNSIQICFVNADCVNLAFRDQEYAAVLGAARLVLADGIGVRLAGSIFNQNIRENINGTDMLPYLCTAVHEAGLSIYLLGGRPGVPESAADWIRSHYPGLKVAGTRNGYFSEEEEHKVLAEIAVSGADILLVALGAPRQEKWIAARQEKTGASVCIGVGGLLDFYSGRIPRAPVWIRELGMEWLFRFWQEPRRMWRRYFVGNAVFLFRVIRERLRMQRGPIQEGGAM